MVFTVSSILDIKKGASDLSRRAVMYHMQGLSFREYLQLFQQITVRPYSLEEIMNHKAEIPEVKHPLPFFENYLKAGYYPFALEEDFDLRLQQVVNQTLETDIPLYAGMNVSTGRKLKQLLDFLYISRNYGIVPIEVKSGNSSRLKSLQLFMQDSNSKIAIRFWGNFESRNKIRASSGKEFTLFSLPYYYAGFIEEYLDEYFQLINDV